MRTNKEVYDFLSSAGSNFGIGFWKPGSGIIHQARCGVKFDLAPGFWKPRYHPPGALRSLGKVQVWHRGSGSLAPASSTGRAALVIFRAPTLCVGGLGTMEEAIRVP